MKTPTMARPANGISVLQVPGPAFDAAAAEAFKERVRDEFARGGLYVLDFGEVEFVSTAGIGAVLSCLRWLTAAGGDLRVCGLCPVVRHSFVLVRLHQVFEFHEDIKAALQSW